LKHYVFLGFQRKEKTSEHFTLLKSSCTKSLIDDDIITVLVLAAPVAAAGVSIIAG